MADITNKIASKHLGKKSEGSLNYDPSLLVAIPRALNREQYNIKKEDLPFDGFDVWHAYEFSAMTENGIPLTRVLKFKYDCNSDFLIESKSLKLYLNSFNMSRFGRTISECLNICKDLIEQDLSKLLKTQIDIQFLDINPQRLEIFSQYKNLMDIVDSDQLIIENFKESPELIKIEYSENSKSYFLMFDSLRSNCRVTHQPDFGDVYIFYKSKKHILETSLIQYLTSFRSEYHFHEECCEMIFKRLADVINKDDELMVCALYTRRGGIDICPVRFTKNLKNSDIINLANVTILARNGIKQ